VGTIPALPLPDPPLVAPSVGLVLRPWGRHPGDADALASAWSDPDIQRWCAVPIDRAATDAARWVAGEAERRAEHGALDLVIADSLDPSRIHGEVGLVLADAGRGFAEVGFWLLSSHRGRALAATAVDLLSTWALRALPVRRLFARVAQENRASVRVVEAAGYVLAGHAAEGELEVWVRDRPSDRPDRLI